MCVCLCLCPALPCLQQWIYTQVHQANVFVEHCVPAAAPLLPPELARKALDVHAGLAQDPTVSQLQRDVGHVLGEMQASATSRVGAAHTHTCAHTQRRGVDYTVVLLLSLVQHGFYNLQKLQHSLHDSLLAMHLCFRPSQMQACLDQCTAVAPG
jgi:hypothetical protein